MNLMTSLPTSVRYVKNGEGGKWWKAAKHSSQIHLGWRMVPHSLLRAGDFASIEPLIRSEFERKAKATQDLNALRTLLDRPSQHVWITFEDGCMWWCTVHDGIEANPDSDMSRRGHFWLTCALPWSNRSLDGQRHLSITNLPGIITAASGFRRTVCEPAGSTEILRVIRNEEDEDARAAALARGRYEGAVAKLVARLREKDFELLIDLVLSRTGFPRLAELGRTREGIDIEAQNATSGEIAFVQVKSSETQAVFDDYVSRFVERRERYDRMIFAVHTPRGNLRPPDGLPVQVAAGTAWLWARPSLQNQQLRRSQRSRKHGRKLTKH